ncbi:MAG: hypothetical protein QOF18_268 [Frankiaceae bacterium]|nr:hypothetical protein [Frankiaceae bacterium]
MTVRLPPAPSREQLVAHLVESRIAGNVATARQSNLANVQKMLDRDPDYWFGLELGRAWTFQEVLTVVAERVGGDPAPSRDGGSDTIDPPLCVDALGAAAELIAAVAADRGRVLLATGHPTGLLALYLPVAAALEAAGCTVITPAAEQWVQVPAGHRRIRYVGGIATLGTGGDLLHTHAPEPMVTVLAAAAEPPDLVVGDHGWAGVAGQAGLRTVGFADSNDPALFVGAVEGKLEVAVPLDDNVAPAAYLPLAAYLLRRLDGSQPH